jgi:flagellar protein FlaF
MYARRVDAYRESEKTAMSGREIEAAALTKAAMGLKTCQDQWDTEGHAVRLDEAIRLTQNIWTILQSELADPGNPLPLRVRQSILSLGAFVDKRLFEVMARPAPEKLSAVIDIHLNLAAGLRGS